MSRPPLSHVPLLIPCLALAAGILAGCIAPWWCIVPALLALAASLFIKHTHTTSVIATFIAGYVLSLFLIEKPLKDESFTETELIYGGEIIRAVESDKGNTLRVVINSWGTSETSMQSCSPIKANISIPGFGNEFSRYGSIRFRARLERVTVRHDLPDETDINDNLLRQRIFYRAIISRDDIIAVSPPQGMRAGLTAFASKFSTLLFRTQLSPSTKTFLNATITGDSSMLAPDTRTTFARAGIAHILALSGLHVGLITMFISVALYPLTIYGHRNVASIITIAALWGYAIATGLSPSVVRAVTMASLYFTGRIFQQQQSPFNSLCFAAIVIMVFEPAALFSIGFQLSFAAVATIILFAETLIPVSKRHRAAYAICSYVAVSISAMLGTGLLSVIYFNTFPVYFLLSNICIALILPVLIGGGILITALHAAGIDIALLCSIIDHLYAAVEWISTTVTSLPGATIGNAYIPAWTAAPYIAVLILTRASIKWHNRTTAIAAAVIAALTITTVILTPDPQSERRIYIAGHHSRTDIIVVTPQSDVMHVITTAPGGQLNDVRLDIETRYRDYMGRRAIDSAIVTGNDFSDGNIRYINHRLQAGSQKLIIIDNDSLLDNAPQHSRYVLLCRGIRADIRTITDAIRPDTLVLSNDLNVRRLERYKREAHSKRIPTIALRDTTFSIRW